MRRCFILLFLGTLALVDYTFGQQVDLKHFDNMRLRAIGPAGMSGRVTSIDAVHSDPGVIFIGTASGGLWKSTSHGMKWKPVFDKQPTSSIGAVAIDQSNPSIVWAGTGEGNPRNSHNSGMGIFRSLDGGHNWQHMGLEKTRNIHRIIVDPRNSDVVYVAAIGSAWGIHKERGVYKTTNGGETWDKILYTNDTTGCADLVMDPGNPNKLIAAMWQHYRRPWTFTSGGKGSGLYVTHDGGKTWQQRGSKHGLPKGSIGRIGLAISNSRPNIVYALVEAKKNALYRSTDGGYNWKKRADENIGNRPFYYADIFVDPENENRLYNLHSIVTKSEDGGRTFAPLLPWSSGVHPDHHAFWIHPRDPNFLIDGNDGGLAISRDRGATWRFVENLPLGQFYHINIDNDVPYNIYGGMQDNGSWVGPSEVWSSGGIKNFHWQEVFFGDGFDVMAKPGNSRIIYAMSQGGNVNRIDRETGEGIFIKPVHPEGKDLRFNWNAAIAQDPFAPCTIYYGSQYVHLSTDCGDSWKIISPDLTTNDPEKQQQAKSGGLTIDATQAENYTSIIAIAPSPAQKGVIWVGTDDGNLQLSKNGGQDWTNLIDKLPGAPKGAWIPQIEVSKTTPGEAFVVLNDYRRDNWMPYVYHTRDFGATWRRIADEKQVDGYALSVVQDPKVENLLFLGTDRGLYVSFDYGAHWSKWTKGFPSVPTRDLKIHPREHDLVIGTFGRSAWVLEDITPLRAAATQGSSFFEKDFQLMPISDAVAAEYRSSNEGRFAGMAQFRGANSGRGATIYAWIKDPKPKKMGGDKAKNDKNDEADKGEKGDKDKKADAETDKAKKSEKDGKKGKKGKPNSKKIQVYILDVAGDTIRNFSVKPDTGLNRFSWWNFSRNGVRGPSYRDRPADRDPQPGARVMPGEYMAIVQWGMHKDSSRFKVLPDPRMEVSAADRRLREQKIEEFYSLARAGKQAFDRLKDVRKAMKQVQQILAHAEEEVRDSLQKEGKTVSDSVKKMMEAVLGPEKEKGLDRVTKRLSDRFWQTGGYLSSGQGRPGANGLTALAQFRTEVTAFVAQVNSFLESVWQPYRKQVEDAKAPLFKDIEPVKME